MYLYEASVTGTETALLAAARASGVTEIRHAATEPHVVELCQFLAKMGAGVSGIGSSSLRVEGVPRLRGVHHELGGDYIEAGSWAVVGAITGGEMAIEGVRAEDIEVVEAVLRRMNVECGMRDGVFHGAAVEAEGRAAASPPGCGRRSRATSSAWSPCWPRRPRAARWCTTGCTSCGSSRSSR